MLKRKRILLVEDEVLVAMLLEDIIAELDGVVVGPEHRLEAAREAAETQALDAAILDLNLHGERSYQVAEVLQKRAVPFLFATGYGLAGLDPPWLSVPLLSKPFTRDDVACALTLILAAKG